MALTINPAEIPAGGEFDYYGKRYATYNKSIEIFAVSNEVSTHLFTINPDHQPITSIAWSDPSNGEFIASISSNILSIYKEVSLNRWDLVYTNNDHLAALTSIAWAPEHLGLHLLVGSLDKSISIFSYNTSSEWVKNSLIVDSQGVYSVSWLFNENIKTFITYGESLNVWEYISHGFTLKHQIKKKFVDVKACSCNSLIAACTEDKLFIYNQAEGFRYVELDVGGNYIQWSAYGTILVVGSEQGVKILRRYPSENYRWEVVQYIKEEGEIRQAS